MDVLYLVIQSTMQLVCGVVYLLWIVYFMVVEVRLMVKMRLSYWRRCWSYVDLGLIVCAWAYVGVSVWRYMEVRRISDLFATTNGYAYVNLQLCSAISDVLTFLLAWSSYFGTVRCLRLCQYHSRLSMFTATLAHASSKLISFAIMFAIVFVSFLCLFYFLFASSMASCATLLRTAATLFEMSLLKFDAQQLSGAASFLGPFCLTLFVVLVVFVCVSMFVSIITHSFQHVREHANKTSGDLFHLLWQQLLRWTGECNLCTNASIEYEIVIQALGRLML
jgi:polycystin 1L2